MPTRFPPGEHFIVVTACAPQPEVARWVSLPDDGLAVCSAARPLMTHQVQDVVQELVQSGQVPNVFQDSFRESRKAYRNTALTQPFEGGVYIVDDEFNQQQVDTSQRSIQDVTDLIDIAQENNATKMFVLTTSTPPTRVAEILGNCQGCAGEGFFHLTEDTTDCLLRSQCHACGFALRPKCIRVAGYSWALQLKMLSARTHEIEDHGVEFHEASNDVSNPEHHIIVGSSAMDSIREFRMVLQPAFRPIPCSQADLTRVCTGVVAQPPAQCGQIVQGMPPMLAPAPGW